MAGDSSSNPTRHPPSSSSSRKSRWESSSSSAPPITATTTTTTTTPTTTTKPPSTPKPNPSPSSHPPPPHQPPPLPPPSYGFHMLERRTIFLADGTVRNYFALPPNYQDFTPPPPRPPLGFFGLNDSSLGPMKRKLGFGDERDNPGFGGVSSPGFRREDEFRASKSMRVGFDHNVGDVKVDPDVMKAFLNFVKVINEQPNLKKNYLASALSGNATGNLHCLACKRSKDYPDMHALIMHAYKPENADSSVDHLGFHKALCVVVGWNSLRAPDMSRAYQRLTAEEAAANRDDLIVWPPMVMVYNTNTGKNKDGRMEGLGNKAMDSKLRDLGFSGGKSKSLYSREGHLGVTLIKFSGDPPGLREAMRLSDHFENERHGRRDWERVQSTPAGQDEENNPNLVLVDPRTGERRRILYGYLATASDLEKMDYETRKKVAIESKREKLQPSK